MEIAGARGKIYPGDRLITDGRSAVHLILYDGSIVRVGFRSEFLLEKVETKGPFISWLFQLMKGGVRALIEKNPKGETHFEINTRSGTVGVRGTEFVLAYDPETNKSSVFMLTGVVDFGENNCQKKTSCIQVKGGEQSFISSGQSRPSSPEKLDYKKLFDVEASGGGKGANWDSRLSL